MVHWSSHRVELTQGGSLELTQGGSLELTQGGSLELTQGGSLELTQGGSLELTQGGSLELTQGGSLELTQGGSLELTQGGSLELTQDGSLELTQGGSLELTQDGSLELTQDGSLELTQGGSLELTQGGSLHLCSFIRLQYLVIYSTGAVRILVGAVRILGRHQDDQTRLSKCTVFPPHYITSLTVMVISSKQPSLRKDCNLMLKNKCRMIQSSTHTHTHLIRSPHFVLPMYQFTQSMYGQLRYRSVLGQRTVRQWLPPSSSVCRAAAPSSGRRR